MSLQTTDVAYYLQKFQKAADKLGKKNLTKKQLEVAVVIYQKSVCLKLYKNTWANKFPNVLTAPSRIFFSIWINETDFAIDEQKIFYNIHALKLRKLDGYKIESIKFATAFRKAFKKFEQNWPHVSTQFGPLTLMQGFINANDENVENEIVKLANQFLEIDFLIDDILKDFKK